jgi:hypothetical protein
MCALFDMYKVDFRGPAMWLGSVHSYSAAAFGIQLSAVRAPGDYAIVNRQTGERTVLSFGLSVDGRHENLTPIGQQASTAAQMEAPAMKKPNDPEQSVSANPSPPATRESAPSVRGQSPPEAVDHRCRQ